MALRFASLGSGSSGNATLICNGEDLVLLDCGFSGKETAARMARLGLTLEQVSAIVVTHEHSDHIKGVPVLARKLKVPVHMTPGTFRGRELGEIPKLRLIHNYRPFQVGSIEVCPVAVPHDAREPAQFVFKDQGQVLGVLTDLGSITQHVIEAFGACDALVLEANHDLQMLAYGPYPPSLKERVSGPWGHLSNEQTLQLIEALDTTRLQKLVVGHISTKNNSLERAKSALSRSSKKLGDVIYACQEQGFDWMQIKNLAILCGE